MDRKSGIAIVTGAGSGIGRAVAIALCKAGWTVALAGRREAMLQETAAMCEAGRTRIVPTDICEPGQVHALFKLVMDHYRRLDLLFNNAGINAPVKPIDELSLGEWQQVINTNLTGAFLCAQEAFRIMKHQNPQGGRIINNGSISAHVPRPHAAPYTASKHAITGLTKSLSLEGRSYNTACGQIDIGNARSPMTQDIQQGALQPDGTRLSEPAFSIEEVGQAVVFMASLPVTTNVPFITIMANQMPYMGRG